MLPNIAKPTKTLLAKEGKQRTLILTTVMVFLHTNFPKFVIISSSDVNKPLSMISPFVLSKALQAALGTLKSVRRQRNGNVLVETDSRTYSAKLLALTDIAGCPVQASAHRTLNSSKGHKVCRP